MKFLLALTLSIYASVSLACTNFTGTYQDETAATYTVQQSACASLAVSSDDGIETIIADGQYRVSSDDSEIRILSAANFIGASLTIDAIIQYKAPFPPEIPTEMIPAKMVTVYTLDSAGNLVMSTTVYNSSNQVIGQATTTHQKI